MAIMARYPSKRDGWLMAVLWIAIVSEIIASVAIWMSEESAAVQLAVSSLLLASAAFILWVIHGTFYDLTETDLRIRSGPFSWRVPLQSIRKVEPTRNPLSSPALSLDRLLIDYGGRLSGVMISPEPRGRFLQDLEARIPDLRRDGDRLIRA